MEKALYLFSSIFLSSGRNIISKKTALIFSGKSSFFLSQALLFGAAAILLLPFSINKLYCFSPVTMIYGVIYGLLLVSSQWAFTIALRLGETSICTVIYSLGFILPTLSGTVFWDEKLSVPNCLGIVLAVTVVLVSAKKKEGNAKITGSFLSFILVAMLSSGGLGIMQKLHQTSSVSEEKTAFLFIAFLLAFIFSMVAFLLCKEKTSVSIKGSLFPITAGLCFGGANFFNTVLAGRMKSGIFFPLQNVLTVLLSAVLGIIIFKEKITAKTLFVLLLGIAVIILFSF